MYAGIECAMFPALYPTTDFTDTGHGEALHLHWRIACIWGTEIGIGLQFEGISIAAADNIFEYIFYKCICFQFVWIFLLHTQKKIYIYIYTYLWIHLQLR